MFFFDEDPQTKASNFMMSGGMAMYRSCCELRAAARAPSWMCNKLGASSNLIRYGKDREMPRGPRGPSCKPFCSIIGNILYHLISSYIILYHLISSYIILYHLISSYIILYHLISSYIILYHLISSYIILYHLISSYIILYHLISSYIILYLWGILKMNTHYRSKSQISESSQVHMDQEALSKTV